MALLRILLLACVLVVCPQFGSAQTGSGALLAIDTSSPQATTRSLLALRDGLERTYLDYLSDRRRAKLAAVQQSLGKLRQLLDLSALSPSARRKVGTDAAVHLMDVLNRIELPPIDSIPAANAYPDPTKPASWTIPGSEIRFHRVLQGERAGEFLFSPDTVSRADEFYAAVKDLPLRQPSSIESWRAEQLQSFGALVPAPLVAALPQLLKHVVLENPIWKLTGTALLLAMLIAAGLFGWTVEIMSDRNDAAALMKRTLKPLLLIGGILLVQFIVVEQFNLIGSIAQYFQVIVTVALYSTAAWLLWLAGFLAVELMIANPTIPNDALDSNLLRLLAQLLGTVGVVMVAAYGAQQLGVPVFGVLAGLGVGGIAVALAAQSSIENLIGGLNLYADRPFRVGDFCTSPQFEGYVEHIGLRSTRVRGLDRTLTTIPNSNVARATLVNLSSRDQMLFKHTLDVSYGTTVEQLRVLLASLVSYLTEHERIRTDVRLPRANIVSLAEWSIKVEVSAYVDTQALQEFLVVQEEFLLRFIEIAQSSGVSLAIPSRTNYLVDCRPSA